MSVENKQKPQAPAKGGAHVAKSGSKISAAAQAAKAEAEKAIDPVNNQVSAKTTAAAEASAAMPKRNK